MSSSIIPPSPISHGAAARPARSSGPAAVSPTTSISDSRVLAPSDQKSGRYLLGWSRRYLACAFVPSSNARIVATNVPHFPASNSSLDTYLSPGLMMRSHDAPGRRRVGRIDLSDCEAVVDLVARASSPDAGTADARRRAKAGPAARPRAARPHLPTSKPTSRIGEIEEGPKFEVEGEWGTREQGNKSGT
ncbi:hypothetical protein THAOC_31698, partial [Thalassiosira oceanica]